MHDAMTNADVARALREMSLFLEMRGVPFKPRAYEKAAQAIEGLDRPIAQLDAEGGTARLEDIPGVGKRIAEKIDELLGTGRIAELEALRTETPVDAIALTAIEGVGPKTVHTLHESLGVRTLDDLERVAREGRIRGLPHFGERAEQRILRGIEFHRQSSARRPLGAVLPLAEAIAARLRSLAHVERAEVAGSIRRRKETVGDADFLVVSRKPEAVAELFATMPEVIHVHARGPTKTLVRLAGGLDADLRVVSERSFGAALHYFTGSKAHNVALRRLAQERGLKLSEYGLFRGERQIAGRTEEDVYAALDLPFIPPELREDTGELEAARRGELPALVEERDLRGDLQVHTDWTDGASSLAEMVRAAAELGRDYVAITDHTRDLAMTRGLDEKRLLEQAAAIREIDRRGRGIRVLTGAEANIRRDGSLDVSDEALAQLDVVGAAVHSHFGLPRDEMTRRVVRAIENPNVDILFHPTARALGKREPVNLDLDAVLAAARRTGTVLEIDAQPERLDLRDEHVRKAVRAGVKLAISSDAHRRSDLRLAGIYGVAVARRGWARSADVVNTLPLEKLRRSLKGGAARRRPR